MKKLRSNLIVVVSVCLFSPFVFSQHSNNLTSKAAHLMASRTKGITQNDDRYNSSERDMHAERVSEELKRVLTGDKKEIVEYFGKCQASLLSDNEAEQTIYAVLTKCSLKDRMIKMASIVDGTSKNKNPAIRRFVYKTLLSVDYSGGDFLTKLMKKQVIKRFIDLAGNTEKDLPAKEELKELSKKLD